MVNIPYMDDMGKIYFYIIYIFGWFFDKVILFDISQLDLWSINSCSITIGPSGLKAKKNLTSYMMYDK